MAELTYEDVRRAVQGVANNLHQVVSDIRSNLQVARVDISRMNPSDMQIRLGSIERVLNDLNQFMQRFEKNFQNGQPLSYSLQQNQQQMYRLEQRIANIEQLSVVMSRYIQAVHGATTKKQPQEPSSRRQKMGQSEA